MISSAFAGRAVCIGHPLGGDALGGDALGAGVGRAVCIGHPLGGAAPGITQPVASVAISTSLEVRQFRSLKNYE